MKAAQLQTSLDLLLQLIVERASAGDMDHVKHALDLFVDAVAILVRVLVILMKNAEKKEQKRKRRD